MIADELLAPAFRARLEALEVALRRSLPAPCRGERRSATRKGLSLEFADHRAYVEGDDVRHLDWAGWARLDQLVVKVYHDDEDVELHVLVDDSASMRCGEPSKARWARTVGAAVAWIGLARGHRVALAMLGDPGTVVPRTRGRGAIDRFLEALAAAPGAGRTPPSVAARRWAAETRPRGVVCLISDLFDRAGPEAVVRALAHPFRALDVVHVLAADEARAPAGGDWRFLDAETGTAVDVDLTSAVAEAYERGVRAFVAEAAEACRRRAAAYVHATTDAPLEDFCLRTLVRAGVLR